MERNVIRIASVLLATLVLVFAAFAVLLKSSWGEDRAREVVEDAINPPMPGGRLLMDRLGDIEMFSPPGVLRATAENVRVLDSEGTELLSVSEATADVDLLALLGRELHVRTSSVSGAQVLCDVDSGRPLIARQPAKRAAFEPRGMDLVVDDLELVGLYAVADAPDGQRVILGRLSGRIDMMVPGDRPGLKMHLWGIKGSISHPRSARIHDATGVVDMDKEIAADIKFSAKASGAEVTGRLWYVPSDRNNPVKVKINNIRELGPGMLGNPLDALRGAGLPMNQFRSMIPKQ